MMTDNGYKMKIGDKAKDFKLKSTEDETVSLSDCKKKLLTIFFTCNHCPYAKAYEVRINNLTEKYEDVDFIGINSNDEENYPQDSFEEMKKRKKERKLKFVYLRDQTQQTAKDFGAECTPHFYLFDKERKLIYQGRMDDNWNDEDNVTSNELESAIISGLKDQTPQVQLTQAIGCSIKWKI